MSDPPPPLPWTGRARRLRRNQTRHEALLWSKLRNRGLAGSKFHRQFAIGAYVVDFMCREHSLIVELDGGQHANQGEQDIRRTRWLEAQGFRVLRFWNNEVMENLAGVLQTIEAALFPSPRPSPEGEGFPNPLLRERVRAERAGEGK
jgi:very-short-patch-repair endonuclease